MASATSRPLITAPATVVSRPEARLSPAPAVTCALSCSVEAARAVPRAAAASRVKPARAPEARPSPTSTPTPALQEENDEDEPAPDWALSTARSRPADRAASRPASACVPTRARSRPATRLRSVPASTVEGRARSDQLSSREREEEAPSVRLAEAEGSDRPRRASTPCSSPDAAPIAW